ncbi:MAG: metallophosphoesterase, partial [Paludibacteraceae bacterium]|nr:metallophosphoesterase [Paludibacteraceae bacterium]
MVYFTGDIHGNAKEILRISTKLNLKLDDVLIILGDVGANYYGERIDCHTKNVLAKAGTTILCIHGNHEMRPSTIPTYKTKEWNGGTVW